MKKVYFPNYITVIHMGTTDTTMTVTEFTTVMTTTTNTMENTTTTTQTIISGGSNLINFSAAPYPETLKN